MSLPTLEHATITVNPVGRYNLIMDDGWVFWDRNDYRDENGDYYTPPDEELCYWRAMYNLATTTDFAARFVVVAESDVPANQIFGDDNNHEVANVDEENEVV